MFCICGLRRGNRQAVEADRGAREACSGICPGKNVCRATEASNPLRGQDHLYGVEFACVSAYLEAAKVLRLDGARHFALRSLDRVLAEAWQPEQGLQHVIAYSDPLPKNDGPGLLDDYAFTGSPASMPTRPPELSYFNFGRKIGDAMIEKFFDKTSGGFFDTAAVEVGAAPLGVLSARRKPFQDSPTPAGNSTAAIFCSVFFSTRTMRVTRNGPNKHWKFSREWPNRQGCLPARTELRPCIFPIRIRRSWFWGMMNWPIVCIGRRPRALP